MPQQKHSNGELHRGLLHSDSDGEDHRMDIENMKSVDSGYPCQDECHFDRAGTLDEKGARAQKKLLWACVFVVIFAAAEVVGGILANSLAILSDAAHLVSDLAGLLISVFALYLTSRGSSNKLSYGWHRAEIIGVLASILLIWGLTAALVLEAINRVREPEDVNGPIVFGIATAGLVFNIVLMMILKGTGHGHSHGGGGHGHGGHGHSTAPRHTDGTHVGELSETHTTHDDESHTGAHHGHGHHGSEDKEMNVNVRAAFIHAIGDLIQSIGVMVAGALIWIDPVKFRIADPICTFVFSVLVLMTTFRLLWDALSVLMDASPQGIDLDEIKKDIEITNGVVAVHDLHVWSISMGKHLISCHVMITQHMDHDDVLRSVQEMLKVRYKLDHSTIQIERSKPGLKQRGDSMNISIDSPTSQTAHILEDSSNTRAILYGVGPPRSLSQKK